MLGGFRVPVQGPVRGERPMHATGAVRVFLTWQWYPEGEQRQVVPARNLKSTREVRKAKSYYQYAWISC